MVKAIDYTAALTGLCIYKYLPCLVLLGRILETWLGPCRRYAGLYQADNCGEEMPSREDEVSSVRGFRGGGFRSMQFEASFWWQEVHWSVAKQAYVLREVLSVKGPWGCITLRDSVCCFFLLGLGWFVLGCHVWWRIGISTRRSFERARYARCFDW